jgi:hypothetical protein
MLERSSRCTVVLLEPGEVPKVEHLAELVASVGQGGWGGMRSFTSSIMIYCNKDTFIHLRLRLSDYYSRLLITTFTYRSAVH